MAELSEKRFAEAVAVWRERMRAHAQAPYVQVIVNEGGGGGRLARAHPRPALCAPLRAGGRGAGAGALRCLPRALRRRRPAQRRLVEEVRRRERLVAIDDEAALICPWASRSPFELRVVPRREAASFSDDEAGATMIRTALRALSERFGRAPELNLWVRTAPRGAEHFHWHVDIAPRLTVKAGFELATGVDINVYPPERRRRTFGSASKGFWEARAGAGRGDEGGARS